MTSVAILGGGISGLTTAYFLKKEGIPFTLFESSNAVGGKIRSTKRDGYLVEHGPNSVQAATPLLNQILEGTGLRSHQVFADLRAKKRFVVKQGSPQPLPMSPPALLRSDLFSLKSKLGLLKEPFTSLPQTDTEESVASFVQRRLGGEFLDYAVDPFVTGIFAGNPQALSLQYAFPSLFKLEQEHGSIFKGLIAGKKNKPEETKEPVARRIFSFSGGMEMLPVAMANGFQENIKLSAEVCELSFAGNSWEIYAESDGKKENLQFDAVVNTLPLPALRRITGSLQISLEPLWQVKYPPVTVMAIGFHKDDVDHPLNGFGMLVPHKESSIRILGTIFSSTVFPNRAPEDHVLLTTLLGGARKGDLCQLPQDLLQDFVLDDLYRLLGVHGNPTFVQKVAWPHAIPQYELGYGQVKQALIDLEAQNKGLFFAGNYRCGISVSDAMKSGFEAAAQVIQQYG